LHTCWGADVGRRGPYVKIEEDTENFKNQSPGGEKGKLNLGYRAIAEK